MLALHRLPDPPGFIFRVQLGGVVRRLMCVEACARTCMHTHACVHVWMDGCMCVCMYARLDGGIDGCRHSRRVIAAGTLGV